MTVAEIRTYLEQTLSTRRYLHSIGVAEEAERLANRYGADAEKAYLAGLIHDCAKEVSPEETVLLLQNYGYMPTKEECASPTVLHGKLGAYIAKEKFGVDDEEMLNAVRYHTTGCAGMSLLMKIVFIADFIEPNRAYPDVEHLRKLTYEDLRAGMLFALDYTIEDLVRKKRAIHPDTVHCRNDLILG